MHGQAKGKTNTFMIRDTSVGRSDVRYQHLLYYYKTLYCHFDQFNASLLNKSNNFFQEKKIFLTPNY